MLYDDADVDDDGYWVVYADAEYDDADDGDNVC